MQEPYPILLNLGLLPNITDTKERFALKEQIIKELKLEIFSYSINANLAKFAEPNESKIQNYDPTDE